MRENFKSSACPNVRISIVLPRSGITSLIKDVLFPELTRSATQKESAEVNARGCDGHY